MRHGDTEESLSNEQEERKTKNDRTPKSNESQKSKEAIVVFLVSSQTFSYLCVYIINTLVYTILCLLI